MLEISCPSGLRGTLRGMKVKDEQLFADRKLAKSGAIIAQLLNSCWMETLDPGPYALVQGTGKPDFERMLGSDRTYALVQLRVASYGSDYEFRVTCGNCSEHFMWGIDLSKLDVKPVSDAGKLHVKTGEPLLVDLPDGRKIKCRLLTGDDERFLANLKPEDDGKLLTLHLARRIVEIDGKTEWRDVVAAVEDMEAGVAGHLWNVTDELEGGVDTTFDVECRRCHNLQRIVLPFEAGFFSSRKRFAAPTSKAG